MRARFQQIRNDLFWEIWDDEQDEITRWVGYDTAYWWRRLFTTDQFQVKDIVTIKDETMNFDQWCESKKIRGNLKKELYRSLIAKYGGIDKVPEDKQVWADEWKILILSKMMGRAYGAVNPK